MRGMTLIVKTVVRIVSAFIVLYGIYIILYGHLTPGGGFPGGVIIASAFILIMLAYGKEVALKRFGDRPVSLLDNLGALGFLVIALLGLTGGYFFFNFINKGQPFRLVSSGTMPLSNIAIGIKVLACLYAVFVALAIFGRVVYRAMEEGDLKEGEER